MSYRQLSGLLSQKILMTDTTLAEYSFQHPGELTVAVVAGIIDNKPLTRKDQGKDFNEFAVERIESDYLRKRIGRSRYQNAICSMRMFTKFILEPGNTSKGGECLYVGDISVAIIEKYIEWRKDIKGNCDETINHALSPILSACQYAYELGWISPHVNARIQEMRISKRVSFDEDPVFDGKSLSEELLSSLLRYYSKCKESRRKEYLEMFLFSFHACGLRIVDVMTLQWSQVDLEKGELRKVLIKTSKRHVIPLSEQAIMILKKWKEKKIKSKYVFALIPDSLNLNNDKELYRARNTVTKCINQSLTTVGKKIGIPFNLTMHSARHTFAVIALNNGMSMSVVSRLLGHGSTQVTEKVYARYLPETLASEMERLKDEFSQFSI